jgi:hypothetical protein
VGAAVVARITGIFILDIDRNRVTVVMRLVLLELETMMMYSFWMSFFSVV